MNPFDPSKNDGDIIVFATQKIHEILETALDEEYLNPEELECVQGQMQDLIRQGSFWLEQENSKRFIYELKNFLEWLVEFIETRKNEQR
jgi:hypothetical protein